MFFIKCSTAGPVAGRRERFSGGASITNYCQPLAAAESWISQLPTKQFELMLAIMGPDVPIFIHRVLCYRPGRIPPGFTFEPSPVGEILD
jgi:hypothetical protein